MDPEVAAACLPAAVIGLGAVVEQLEETPRWRLWRRHRLERQRLALQGEVKLLRTVIRIGKPQPVWPPRRPA